MSRNMLYLICGALAVVVAILGYQYFERRESHGVEIKVGEDGVSIQKQ